MIKLLIGQKIFIGFFILIVLSASFLLISFPSIAKINILSSMVVPLSREMSLLQKYTEKVKQLENKIELYLTIRSEESRDELIAALKESNDSAVKTIQREKTEGLQNVTAIMIELGSAIEVLLNYIDNKESTYKINLQTIAVNKLFQKFEETQDVFQKQRLEQLQKSVSEQKAIIGMMVDSFLVIEMSIVVFGFLASLFLSKLITRNLSKLHKATQEIAAGNFQTRIDVSSKDEIGELAHSFNLMAEDLRTKTVSKEYLDNIIHSMADALIVVNPDLTISSMNKATCELLGYSEDELINKSIRTIFSTEGTLLEGVEFENLIKEAKLMNCEINYKSKDAKNIPVLLSASVMKDKGGSTICIICTATNITERKMAEEKLKELMEIKSKLTSMVSHELRTPLAAIRTGINLVLDGLAGEINVEQKEVLDITKVNVDRLARLINDVLDFHKLESKKMQFKIEENDINMVVMEIYNMTCPLIEKKGLKFTLSLAKDLPKAMFDRDRIAQVLSNLVNNAMKFTEKGEIIIFTEREPSCIHVKVSDTGMGIGLKDMSRIFQSFEQLELAGNAKIEGTGLGLAICKEIIEQHNGKIWVESEANKGSTFHFVLPTNREGKAV
jgi:two-component system phosphate regulon sensor histidine kinase PhoR